MARGVVCSLQHDSSSSLDSGRVFRCCDLKLTSLYRSSGSEERNDMYFFTTVTAVALAIEFSERR